MTTDSALDSVIGKDAINRIIAQRKTSKILLPVEQRGEACALWNNGHTDVLMEMIALAAWAPFHRRAHDSYRQGDLNAPMPWRFHVLLPASVNRLLEYLENQAENSSDEKWSRAWQSKIKNMLSACGALVQVTWLPDPSENTELPELSRNNIEHIAAAGAAVQNLLLSTQARQWESYWSSGGILRDEDVFTFMGISPEEQLLGSIFLTPSVHPQARVVAGGLRDQRGDVSGWVRTADL